MNMETAFNIFDNIKIYSFLHMHFLMINRKKDKFKFQTE